MVQHKTEIGGKAMAVLVGVICLIAPWLSSINWIYKILIVILGVILIGSGIKD